MTQNSSHSAIPLEGRGADPSARGGTVGAGLVPEESIEGAAEQAAAEGQPNEGLIEPGGVDTEEPG
jgi:hypothetical protein